MVFHHPVLTAGKIWEKQTGYYPNDIAILPLLGRLPEIAPFRVLWSGWPAAPSPPIPLESASARLLRLIRLHLLVHLLLHPHLQALLPAVKLSVEKRVKNIDMEIN